MAASGDIPSSVSDAFARLQHERADVTIVAPLTRQAANGRYAFVFRCAVGTPQPNQENLPARVELAVLMDDSFPFSPVEVYPADAEVRGFPHQDAETGKLCLKEERLAHWDDRRLVEYVTWAEEWVTTAAQGQLLNPGEPYELPDFSRRRMTTPPVFPGPLLIAESGASLPGWQSRIGQTGTVDLALVRSPEALAALAFKSARGEAIHAAGFSKAFLDGANRFHGTWVLLEDIRYFRNRPPQSLDELATVAKRCGVEITTVLRNQWQVGGAPLHAAIVLVGWPIPAVVGGPVVRVHWQPIAFPDFDYFKHRLSSHNAKKTKPNRSWSEMQERLKELPWGRTENVAPDELCSRSHLKDGLRKRHVVVIGCGAVGSLVAELLARGGATRLSLFDADAVRYGNLCRHTLAGGDVGSGKAQELARRLASVNPCAEVDGFEYRVPFKPSGNSGQAADAALRASGVLVDCTTSDGAGIWLSRFARREQKRMAMMFIDFRAEHLTLCLSGRNTSCERVSVRLYEDIRNARTPIPGEEYFRQPSKEELLSPGAGCWHPTFPASLHDIQALVAAAVGVLNDLMELPGRCDGCAVVFRRKPFDRTIPHTLVEVAWKAWYR